MCVAIVGSNSNDSSFGNQHQVQTDYHSKTENTCESELESCFLKKLTS